MNVLYVCHGNVNRSAAAEIITKQLFPELNVLSCGLKTFDGKITAKRMRDTLIESGYPTSGIRSKLINQDLVDWADEIWYMDAANERRFVEQFGKLEKAKRLSDLIPGVDKIPDPAFASGNEMHQKVIGLIVSAVNKQYGV